MANTPRKVKRYDMGAHGTPEKTRKPAVSAGAAQHAAPRAARKIAAPKEPPKRETPTQVRATVSRKLTAPAAAIGVTSREEGVAKVQTAPKRHRLLWGAVACCLLAAALCGGFFLWRKHTQPAGPSTPTAPAPGHRLSVGGLPAYKVTEADLVVAGDIMCLAGQLSAAKVSGGWDFDYAFDRIAPILKSADYAIGNLEVPLAGADKGVTAYNQPGTPVLNAPDEFLDAVAEAGFDMVSTANNHSFDKGDQGRIRTIELLDKAGIVHSGTYVSPEAQQNTPISDVGGIPVAILSYTQFVNTGTQAYKDSGELYKLNLLDPETVGADIAAARERGAEYVILFVHWGVENVNYYTAEQQQTAQLLADAGADLIIGSHSHTVQPAEYLTSKDGREVFVIYSMGNLISSMPRAINQDTLLLNLHLTRKGGEVALSDISYMAISGGTNAGRSYAALPSRLTAERGHQTGRMNASANRISAILSPTLREDTLFSYVDPEAMDG